MPPEPTQGEENNSATNSAAEVTAPVTSDVNTSEASNSNPANDTPDVATQNPAPTATPLSGDKPGQTAKPAPKSMAEAVEMALKAGEVAEKATPQKTDASETSSPADAAKPEKTNAEDTGNPSGEEDLDPDKITSSSPPEVVHRGVRKLLAQRHELRQQNAELEPDANSFRQIRHYMTENKLDDSDTAELFQLGADLKSGDPKRLAAFLQRVLPTVQSVMEALGQSVPEDLREQVEAGEMTEDAAREFAKTRHAQSYAEQRADASDTTLRQQQTAAQQSAIRTAVAKWEATAKATDPDFSTKAELMPRLAQAMIAAKGAPKNPTEAVLYAREVYKQANEFFVRARPTPKATRPTPSTVQPSATRSGLAPSNTPKSLEDVVNSVLQQGT